MGDLILVELAQEQVPKSLVELQQSLEKNGLHGDYHQKNNHLHLHNEDGKLKFSLFYHDPTLEFNRGYGIEVTGNVNDLAATLIDLVELFEFIYEDCVISSEHLEPEESFAIAEYDDYFNDLSRIKFEHILTVTIENCPLTLFDLGKKLYEDGFYTDTYRIIDDSLIVNTGWADTFQFIISINNHLTQLTVNADAREVESAISDLKEVINDVFPDSVIQRENG